MLELQSDVDEMTKDSNAPEVPDGLAARIEALLLVAERPMTEHRIFELLDVVTLRGDVYSSGVAMRDPRWQKKQCTREKKETSRQKKG